MGSSKKEAFELPEGFEIKEHKTEKSKWKEYVGPDGKKYRSLADVKKSIDSTSAHYDAEKVDEVIDFVVKEWTPDDLNKTDYANSEVVKEFPLNNTFFETAKKKASILKNKNKNDPVDMDKSLTETVTESSLERSMGHLGTDIESVINDTVSSSKSEKKKKKKEKKKKKHESSME